MVLESQSHESLAVAKKGTRVSTLQRVKERDVINIVTVLEVHRAQGERENASSSRVSSTGLLRRGSKYFVIRPFMREIIETISTTVKNTTDGGRQLDANNASFDLGLPSRFNFHEDTVKCSRLWFRLPSSAQA